MLRLLDVAMATINGETTMMRGVGSRGNGCDAFVFEDTSRSQQTDHIAIDDREDASGKLLATLLFDSTTTSILSRA